MVLLAILAGIVIDSTPAHRFDALAQRHLTTRARTDPEWATRVGIHAYDSRLTDRTVRAFLRDTLRAAEQLRTLRSIDTTELDLRRRVDWLLLESVLRTELFDARQRPWERRPSIYLPFGAIHQLVVATEPGPVARMGALRRRLEAWPGALAAGRAQLHSSRTPRRWVELDAGSARRVAAWLRDELPALVGAQGGNTPAFREALASAVAATESWEAWLGDTLLPAAAGDWRAGRPSYNWRLANSKMLKRTATELIEFGYAEFHRTEQELADLANQIDSTRSWRRLADSARSLHPPADSVLAAYTAENDRARAFVLERAFVSLPRGERLDMILTPPHLRQTYAYGGYSSVAPFEKARVGRFFVTPVEPGWSAAQIESKLRGHNHGWITVVSVHEGYPGHHLQTVHAANQPSQLRKVYGSEVFGEGWGLYAEELMYRHGFYQSPLARLTQLRMRLWRAARVIIDPSLHTGRWSVDEAVRFFVDSVGLEHADALAEVTRYTTWPTQAVSYLIGMHEIERLRDDLRSRLGERFSERAFHDALLSQGSLPPPLMRRATFAALGADPSG